MIHCDNNYKKKFDMHPSNLINFQCVIYSSHCCPVCLLLSLYLLSPSTLSRRSGEVEIGLLLQGTALPQCGPLVCDSIMATLTSLFLLQQQRRLDLLTITSPKNLEPGTRCKMVFITARVHPGESPSSYVCQGIYFA